MSKAISFSSKISVGIVIFLFFFTIYFHHVHSYNDNNSSSAEKSILLQLKEHLSIPIFLYDWNSSSYHCTWPGITCFHGSVTEISIRLPGYIGIDQTFPPSICGLKNLESIDLGNSIPGSFPTSLYNCSKLKYLDLSGNSFTGRIPENIDRLLPPDIKYLVLGNISFSGGIPAAIGNFTLLEYLDLSQNCLTDVFDNRLPGRIPTQLATLPYLIHIDLRENQLSGLIPSAIGTSSNLSYLCLSNNEFYGEIPSEIGNISSLRYLNLSANKFSGKFLTGIWYLLKLEYLDLSVNEFSGKIPYEIRNLASLEHLDISVNNFSGELGSEIGELSKLEHLDVSFNEFCGKIPYEIGNICLRYLNLSANKFHSQIPSEIWSSPCLQYLVLSKNKFSGKIPYEIWNLPSLEHLDISVNNFSGKLRSEIGELSNLEHLDLSFNEFSGKIPSKIGKLSSLRYLNLSENKFHSQIPFEIWSLPYLQCLDLSQNKFSGKIPSEIFLPNLRSVNLSSNHLCGSVPQKLKYSFPPSCFSDTSESCNKSNPPFAAILSITLAVVLLIVAFTFYLFVAFRFYLYKFTWNGLYSAWKLIPFQKLDFTESTILSSLIESNVIGSGGSGNVYKVQLSSSGESCVAVKRICINRKTDRRLEKQFLSELQILGTVRHLNILKLMCCFSSENSKLLVYEFMENGSLDEWLHGKRRHSTASSSFSQQTLVLEWPKRLHIAISIAQGLCYMHHCFTSPIIHRDLKSSNILLDSQFNAKIADFGLARILDNDALPRTMSVVAGTFGYIAPECAHTTRINEKVDVYSFGVILLELVTGRKAHQGDENSSLAEWAWRHIQHGNPIVDALDEDIKDTNYFDEMIKLFKLGIFCTHTSPSNRPTMKEVQGILRLSAHPSAPSENIPMPNAMSYTREDKYFHSYSMLRFFKFRVHSSVLQAWE